MAARRLLLVDDEPEFGKLVRRVAEEQDFDVTVTQQASDFMKAYEKVDPTHIILDIVMPGTDGIEWVGNHTPGHSPGVGPVRCSRVGW